MSDNRTPIEKKAAMLDWMMREIEAFHKKEFEGEIEDILLAKEIVALHSIFKKYYKIIG